MAESKGSGDTLNQAYFGAPILPHKAHPPPPPRRRLEPYTLLCLALRTLTLVLIAAGVAVVVLWLTYQPQTLRVFVDRAALARFDLAPNGSAVRFHLALQMRIRNPNKKYDVHYKRLEASALYAGSRLGHVSLPRPWLKRKSTLELAPVFVGEGAAVAATAKRFRKEQGEGFFWINVRIYSRVRLKMFAVQSAAYVPEIDCLPRVPALRTTPRQPLWGLRGRSATWRAFTDIYNNN